MSEDQKINALSDQLGISLDNSRSLLEASGWDLQRAIGLHNTSTASTSRSGSGPSGGSRGGVSTLSDLNKDKGKEKQSYFTGGAKSGMLVEDSSKPSAASQDSDKMVEQILKKAAETGRNTVQSEQDKTHASFKGTGYKLGSEDVPSVVLKDDSVGEHEDSTPEIVTRNMTFWQNGFSIDDGELFSYDDPKNKMILEAINQGRAPLSLFDLKPGQQADVQVSHKLNEPFVQPKKKVKAFSGAGNRLGSAIPEANVAASGSTPVAPSAPALQVDPDKPSTSIQVRLSDGTRLIVKINLHHTVGDLRQFIASSRPASRSFVLQTQFPTTVLSDDSLTIEAAGLKSATIFQKLA